jgi:TonB family protein
MSDTEVRQSEVRRTELWKSWEGRVVDGKFTLRRLLGASEHSGVFLTQRQSSQKAAIKLIPAATKEADAQLAHWRAAAQISHPHLLAVYESGRCQMDGAPYLYLLTECADEDLSQILPHRGLTPGEAADLLPPLLDALSYLHGKGLVHGRVKPSNVLAVGDQLRLSSDHIAPSIELSNGAQRRDVYDPPEAAAGIVSPAGDMWAVGVTLVAAMTQNVPFSAELSPRDPVAPEKMPEPFRGIARECLHLDPKRRCTVADVQARLQPAARSVPAAPEPAPTPQRGLRRGPIALGLALIVIVGIIVIYSRGKSTAPAAPADQPAAQTSSAPPSTSQNSPPASSSASQPAPQTPAAQTETKPTPAPPAPQPAAPRQRQRPSAASGADGNGVLHQVIPEVPRSARNTITGKIRVVVRVDVDASGKVTNATLSSPGPSNYFAGLALKAAREWEFAPAASTWSLRFYFGRRGTQVSPERSSR